MADRVAMFFTTSGGQSEDGFGEHKEADSTPQVSTAGSMKFCREGLG